MPPPHPHNPWALNNHLALPTSSLWGFCFLWLWDMPGRGTIPVTTLLSMAAAAQAPFLSLCGAAEGLVMCAGVCGVQEHMVVAQMGSPWANPLQMQIGNVWCCSGRGCWSYLTLGKQRLLGLGQCVIACFYYLILQETLEKVNGGISYCQKRGRSCADTLPLGPSVF